MRYEAGDLPGLFAGAESVTVGKGAKSRTFSKRDGTMDAAELTAAALGPSGNLRAPAVRVGKRWLVGYCEPAWTEFFGA